MSVVYEVTAVVEHELAEEWERYMRERHIPDVLATGWFTRASLVRQLEAWGHSVTASEDGEQAWDRYQAADFDLVLTDWEMPRLSGLELIKRIRAAASTHFVYLIMLTGRSDKSDVVSGIEAGADDFVAKPFDREELRVRILAGDRVVRLERALSTQNEALRAAGERMRRDLRTSDSIAEASVAAIARQDPGELHTLRDQLLGYRAVLAEAAPALSATNDNPPISSDRP